jgi:hypothetical protein
MSREQRPEERAALETRGQRALEDATEHEPREVVRHLRPLLRLWSYPAFLAYTSWTVFDPPDDTHTRLLRQVQWDRPYDLLPFADPLEGVKRGWQAPPTLSIRDAQVADALLRRHLEELRRLPIPVAGVEAPVGVDGELFGLQYDGVFLATRLQWWEEGPQAWSAFTLAVTRLRNALAEHFD